MSTGDGAAPTTGAARDEERRKARATLYRSAERARSYGAPDVVVSVADVWFLLGEVDTALREAETYKALVEKWKRRAALVEHHNGILLNRLGDGIGPSVLHRDFLLLVQREVAAALAEIPEGKDYADLRPPAELPLHRTEAAVGLVCSTCDGGGCPDCTDPAS